MSSPRSPHLLDDIEREIDLSDLDEEGSQQTRRQLAAHLQEDENDEGEDLFGPSLAG